jgi:predicted Zn finger-like uncharacterized protein
MAIEFVCPACKSGLRVGEDTAGKVVRCGSCMTTVRVPAAAALPAPGRPGEADEPLPSSRPDRRPVELVAPPGTADRPAGRPTRRRRPPPPRKGRGPLFWILVVLGIVAVLGAATCAGVVSMLQPKWRTHDSQKGGFKVQLPAPPRDDMRRLANLENKPEVEVEGTVLVFDGEEFGVMYWDIDAETRRHTTDERLLKSIEDEMKKGDAQLRVVRSEKVMVSGFPGRKLILSHPDEGSSVCLIVVAETRVYVVYGGSRNMDAEHSPHVKTFIESFEITDQNLMAKAAARKLKEKKEEEAEAEEQRRAEREEAEAALEDERNQLRIAGRRLAGRVTDEVDTEREAALDALAALEQARQDLRDAGRATGRVALVVADRERTSALDRPDLPVAPPPRPRSGK